MNLANQQLLAGGAYARKQLYCKDRIVAWSHGSRFRTGRRLAEAFAGVPPASASPAAGGGEGGGARLLDYGCGSLPDSNASCRHEVTEGWRRAGRSDIPFI